MRCCYSPAPGSDIEEHFEYFLIMARRAQNMVLYIDEVDQMCSPNGMMVMRSHYWTKPENKKRRPPFHDLLDSGRHAGLAAIFMSRMPQQVNVKLRDNCNEMRIFRQSGPGIVGYFRDKIGEDAHQIPRLGTYEYVLWQDGKKSTVRGGRR